MAHMPLIVRSPGVSAGPRCKSLVSLLDLVPVFYQTRGVVPPKSPAGQDLSPLLNSPTGRVRDVVFSEIQYI